MNKSFSGNAQRKVDNKNGNKVGKISQEIVVQSCI